jgi:vacuolar protein sorting-associated protein 45
VILALVMSQSDILQEGVYLVEQIHAVDAANAVRMPHLAGVFFLRPTSQNFALLEPLLQAALYGSYHVFFTNAVPQARLEALARGDEADVVAQIHEYFADVYAINDGLFSLGMPSTMPLCKSVSAWSSAADLLFSRLVDGVVAALVALKISPIIRYGKKSELCSRLAAEVGRRMQVYGPMIPPKLDPETTDVLLLMDRRDDPITPLLNQWTYQAMVHEILTLTNNRVDLRGAPGTKKELEQIVLSSKQDSFFAENMLSNFGDLGANVKEHADKFQTYMQTSAQIDTLEEMQKMIEEYPEFAKMSGNVSKHVTVVHELSRLVQEHGILEVSALEQDLACSDAKSEHLRSVLDCLRKPLRSIDRLRLALLYMLRYETNAKGAEQIRTVLAENAEEVDLLDKIIQYAGADARTGDLFGKKSVLANMKTTLKDMKRGVKGVENVYTQHKSYLHGVVEKLIAGKLKESIYPSLEQRFPGQSRVGDVVAFVVGGATFEESRDLQMLQQGNPAHRIFLGGSSVLNTSSFLDAVQRFGDDSDETGQTKRRGSPERRRSNDLPYTTVGRQTDSPSAALSE